MSNRYIAVCDIDEHYSLALSSSVASVTNNLLSVITFTSAHSFISFCEKKEVSILIITESTFDSSIIDIFEGTLIVLRENPEFVLDGAILIDRFQSREALMNSVLKSLPEYLEGYSGTRLETYHWKTIGIYSPVRRCLQTSFALALGQMLAKDKKVLYMNFESFSGFSGWFQTQFEMDVLDLIYFFNCEPEKIQLRLPQMIYKLGDLDILPPAASYYDTYEKSGEKWIELFDAIENSSEYDYLILDLSDAMTGLMQVLGYCDRVYTLVKDDPLSKYKMDQYERWMVDHSYADIIGKSMKFSFPEFQNMSIHPGMLTHSEMASYVRAIIEEDKIRE